MAWGQALLCAVGGAWVGAELLCNRQPLHPHNPRIHPAGMGAWGEVGRRHTLAALHSFVLYQAWKGAWVGEEP